MIGTMLFGFAGYSAVQFWLYYRWCLNGQRRLVPASETALLAAKDTWFRLAVGFAAGFSWWLFLDSYK